MIPPSGKARWHVKVVDFGWTQSSQGNRLLERPLPEEVYLELIAWTLFFLSGIESKRG